MFDRFDVCEAYYIFAAEWHKGRCSSEYAIFSRLSNIGFKPGVHVREWPTWKASRDSDGYYTHENVRRILAQLIRRARRGETVGRRNRNPETGD